MLNDSYFFSVEMIYVKKYQISELGVHFNVSSIADPQFETTCSYVEATLEEFLTWNSDLSITSGPFRDYDRSKFWAYADYKYCASLFEDKMDIFQVSQYILNNHGNHLPLRRDCKLEFPNAFLSHK